MTEPAQLSKKSLRRSNVLADLFSQQVGRIKAALVPQPAQELESRTFCRRWYWRVQYERFDGQRVSVECRTHPHVGHPIEIPPAIERYARDVHTNLGQELVVGFQIESGHGDVSPATGARNDLSFEFK